MMQRLANSISLYQGDCLELLPTLDENSIDACVTDPPYHLTSIVKRFGKSNLERDDQPQRPGYNDEGSAARFFYTAKADSDDRLGSRHPTVKPLDLMQYLVRLVTPKGGTVLDCFAGTGMTGEAAWREGMKAVLIEREEEYCKDVNRRIKLMLSGPDERKRESVKHKIGEKKHDIGPLFSQQD